MGHKQGFLGVVCAVALLASACDDEGGRPDLADEYGHAGGKADGAASCLADPDPVVTTGDAWACFSEDFGPEQASDWTEDALYAGNGRIDYIACVDGVVYGTAGAVTALGVGVLWGGAIIEPTPGGEVVAAIVSAPMLGFLGGTVGVKISGSVDACLVPLANVGLTAARNGRNWVMRGLRSLVRQVFQASGSREAQRKLKQLSQNTGADEHCLSDALHDCKAMYPGNYNVDIDTRTGRVTDPRTGEEICNLLDYCL